MKMKRFLAVFLMAILLCPQMGGALTEDLRPVEQYQRAFEMIFNLQDTEAVHTAKAIFQDLGDYQFSAYYSLYLDAVIALQEGKTGMEPVLQLLDNVVDFKADLADHSLPACADLIQYAEARKLENEGQYQEAIALYNQINVLDAITRAAALILGSQKDETAKVTPAPTVTPAPMVEPTAEPMEKPTPKPSPESTKKPTAKPTATPTQWGPWSKWSTKKVTANKNRQVETKVENKKETVTKYRYGRYRYTFKEKNGNISWGVAESQSSAKNALQSGEEFISGKWQTTTTTKRKKATYNYYGSWPDMWWTEEAIKSTVTKKVTYYRYRVVKK